MNRYSKGNRMERTQPNVIEKTNKSDHKQLIMRTHKHQKTSKTMTTRLRDDDEEKQKNTYINEKEY